MTSSNDIPEGAIVLGVGLDPDEATDFYAQVQGNQRVTDATVLTTSDEVAASVGKRMSGVYIPEAAPVTVVVGAKASAETVNEVLRRISSKVKILKKAI